MALTTRVVRHAGVEMHVGVTHTPPFSKCKATLRLKKHDGVDGEPIDLPVPLNPSEFSSPDEAFEAAFAMGEWLIDAVTDWGTNLAGMKSRFFP